jgi:hypothetical protein
MWQHLRNYWLPLMLFLGASMVAISLLLIVIAVPLFVDYLPAHPLLTLLGEDATVRRSCIAGAIGLIVTAFVFFRPNASGLARKAARKPSPHDTMAGA